MKAELKEWLENLDGDDLCKVCIYREDCNHIGVNNYGGNPIYSPCMEDGVDSVVDMEEAERTYYNEFDERDDGDV